MPVNIYSNFSPGSTDGQSSFAFFLLFAALPVVVGPCARAADSGGSAFGTRLPQAFDAPSMVRLPPGAHGFRPALMPNRRQPLRRPRQAHMQRALEYQGCPFPHDGEHKDRHKVRSATRKAARHARQDGSPGCAFAAAARSRTAVCRGRVRRRSPCILPLPFVNRCEKVP